MKNSSDRILTTHTGSLPRPDDLVGMIRARELGESHDDAALAKRVRDAVSETVKLQAESGVDIVSDGEMGKPGFFQYVRNRLNGLEVLDNEFRFNLDPDFPDYAAWRNSIGRGQNRLGGTTVCSGPLSWKDKAALDADIANFKAGLAGAAVQEAFMPSVSVGIIAQRMQNRYYPTYEAYVEAIAEVIKDEYRAITDAGFLLQIDAPEMCIDRNQAEFRDQPLEAFHKRLDLWVEALNHALGGIPEEKVRFHVCWGNGEGPHIRDIPLEQIVDIVLNVKAQAYSVEASNPRHAHEWRVWEDTKLPEGKLLIPGVIESCNNYVEHPRLVADGLIKYASLVGRENVIAGSDCGYGTSANSTNVYPPIVWAKFRAMSEGAAIATKELR